MYARTTPPSFSPHSSPPSSPSLYYNDSSPPSSPGLEPLDPPYDIAFDNSASGNLAHPYAASAKAGRALRAYEKKPVTSHTADDREPAKKYRRLYSDAIGLEVDEDIDLDLDIPEVHMSAAAAEDKEKALWDSAIASVFDSSQGSLDLAQLELTYIPDHIVDLANFFVTPQKSEPADTATLSPPLIVSRSFRRVATEPASNATTFFSPRLGLSERTTSIADVSVGRAREEVQLFLASNKIRYLPSGLFRIQRLTVLSLRQNCLSYLPPEIAHLVNLRELTLSNNRLTFLPSEILGMKLAQLNLFPNPFLETPEPATSRRSTSSRSLFRANSQLNPLPRPVSSKATLASFPSLRELVLRTLVSPYDPSPTDSSLRHPTEHNETVYETYYGLGIRADPPPRGCGISEPLQDTLNTCIPGACTSVYATRSALQRRPTPPDPTQAITGIGVCPAPHHGTRRSLFVQHAEERFTWEHTIAGQLVGGSVPVRWRGCQLGCLDFLEPPKEPPQAAELPPPESGMNAGLGSTVAGAGGDGDVEMEDVVRVVTFADGGLGEDWD